VVAVEYCGICGTDLHMVLDGWGAPDSIFGHEWAGRIVEPGDSGLSNSTLVVGTPSTVCGECESCRAARPSLCRARPAAGVTLDRGAFAQYVAVGADRLVAVPDGIDARAAAYAEPLAVALHAVTLSDITDGQTALVTGAGPIGAAIIALLATRGISVTAVEPGAGRAALAGRLGADVCAADDLEVTGHPGEPARNAVDTVFETSGARSAIETGLTQLVPGGTLVLVGTGVDYPKLDTNRVILNELRVAGAFNYDAGGFEDALSLIGSGRLPVDDLITDEHVSLDELLPTMHRLRAGEIPGKAMVKPNG
jgi:2-desacetyl-2-hydroxyethyl bacteriochlorophyllide A dehydrogenase